MKSLLLRRRVALFRGISFFLSTDFTLARVTRVEISSRTVVLDGKSFGDAGPYERIIGKIYFSVAVANPHNQAIVDLANAVNLQNGQVEFSADFVAIRPRDPSRG